MGLGVRRVWVHTCSFEREKVSGVWFAPTCSLTNLFATSSLVRGFLFQFLIKPRDVGNNCNSVIPGGLGAYLQLRVLEDVLQIPVQLGSEQDVVIGMDKLPSNSWLKAHSIVKGASVPAKLRNKVAKYTLHSSTLCQKATQICLANDKGNVGGLSINFGLQCIPTIVPSWLSASLRRK